MKITFSLSLLLLLVLSAFAQPATWSPRGVGGGGALFSPSINPADNNEYYVSCDMSELFHSDDMGGTYEQVHFTQFQGGHNSRVSFTNTPGLLYSIRYVDDIGGPVKSTDDGVTWTALPGNPDPYEEVYSIRADFNNPNRVIISSYNEIYFSNDGGNNFTSFHTATNSGAGNVVGGVFFDGNTIYVGTNDGVLVSTNAGANWSTATITGLPSNERIWSFCAAKASGTTRFFCITADENDIYVGLPGSDYWGFAQGVYSCDYGSGNWVARSNGITANDFPMFIDMAENDITTVYMAGSNDIAEPTVFKTTDAGMTWTNTFLTNNNQNITTGWSGDGGDRGWSYGECPFGFDVAANNPNALLFSDFGFVHVSSDGGTNWAQAYVNAADAHPAGSNTPAGDNYHSIGLENTTCWQVHWVDANTVWACFSDIRGVRSTDGGQTWSFNYTGNPANSTYRVVQLASGTLVAATSNVHDMYQSTRLSDALLDANDANGKLIYSTNGGAAWQDLHVFNHPVFWIALDPSNPNRAYASVIHYDGGSGVGGVYRSDDLNSLAGSTWTLLPNPPRTEKHPASLVVLNDGTLVATYSGRRTSNGFTASSGVFTYNPNNNSWADVSDPGMHYWTKDIVVDPNDATQNTWYVGVFSGWGGPPNGLGGLYRTTDRGANWTKLTGSTLDRVTSMTFHPTNPDEVYVTTEVQGMWTSSDITSGSPTFTQVGSYPFRQPERVFFNPFNQNEMWVTSFGNGMKMGLMTGVGIAEEHGPGVVVYPNPVEDIVRFDVDGVEEVRIYDLQGRLLQSKSNPGRALEMKDLATGAYILVLQLNDGRVERVRVVK